MEATTQKRVDPRPVMSLTRARPRIAPRAGKREEVGRADMLVCLGDRVSGQRLRPVPVQQPETDIYAQPRSSADRSLPQGRHTRARLGCHLMSPPVKPTLALA